jgi:PIN domain nuclease of toxin-antitoxin system
VRLLLDTHIVLWSVTAYPAMPKRFRDILRAGDHEIYVSAVSIWEVSIKRAIGKMPAPADVFDRAKDAGCLELPVTWAHARIVESMPLHHADPFDRLLIAQARVEGLTLVTADRVISKYDVALL